MQALYEVPVIPNNLRHEETMVQTADALNFLCNVFDDIINKVNVRVEYNKTRLNNLTERINVSTEKITKLTGTKKATQVFSSSKYPATDIHKRYRSIFSHSDDDNKVVFMRSKMKYKDPMLTDHPLEKLRFFHVKISDNKQNKPSYHMEEGLGSFPKDVGSINELLLFNTSKNPYKNYVMSDPLQASQYTKEANEIIAPGPDAAPLSISSRTGINRSVGENYFYSPGLGDVPIIDVPLDLPDLPGVADDLRYLMESGPGIAPSVTTTPSVPELPSIVQTPSEPSLAAEPILPDSEPLPPLPTPVSVEHIPVAPPAPIEEPVVPPAPVPLPQVEPTIPVLETPQKEQKKIKEKHIPAADDARASLMAAIRQAGGAKKAKLRNTEPQQKEEKWNLMADLNAKLALRRKGISGSKASEGSEMTSALSKISAMIPPPLPQTDLDESTNTEDDDWDE